MAFQKAISYLKKTVFHPAEIVKLIDQHSSTLNVSGIELIKDLAKQLNINLMYERTTIQDYRRHLALGLFSDILAHDYNENNEVSITPCHVSLPLRNVLRLFIKSFKIPFI